MKEQQPKKPEIPKNAPQALSELAKTLEHLKIRHQARKGSKK